MKDCELPSKIPAPRIAGCTVIFASFCYSLITVTNVVITGADAGRSAGASLCVCVVLAVQVVNSSPQVRRWRVSRRVGALGIQALLVYAPAVWLGAVWGGMLGCLAGSVPLLLHGRAAWIGFGVVNASALALAFVVHPGAFFTMYMMQSTMLTGLVAHGLTRLSRLVGEAYASRDELARTAVRRERLRFARDLHDLLGYSLSSITLRAELIHRLAGIDADRIRTEIAEVLTVSRQALVDVRLVAGGYHHMSLAEEADEVASTLSAANVCAEIDVNCGRLHPLVDTVLAAALREGVTNMLRHSKMRTCGISAAEDRQFITLTVVNDGVVALRARQFSHGGGNGLDNIRARLDAIGGQMEAGLCEDGRFQLLVQAPLRPEGWDRRVIRG